MTATAQANEKVTGVQEVKLSIPCVAEYVGIVRLAISGIAARMNFPVEDVEDLKIAISEACSNCVQYAYDDGEKNVIDIHCQIHSDKLVIDVVDTGQGFDYSLVESNQKKPSTEINLGLGLTFIKNLMDEMTVDSKIGEGTTVSIVKFT